MTLGGSFGIPQKPMQSGGGYQFPPNIPNVGFQGDPRTVQPYTGVEHMPQVTNAPLPGLTQTPRPWNQPLPSTGPVIAGPNGPVPQMGGTTRRGSQILDAQGNVIGHYDDNNQPVYHNGQGPQGPQMPTGPKFPGWGGTPAPPMRQPDGSWRWNGQPFDPQNPPPFYRPQVDPGGYIPTPSQRAGEGWGALGVPGSMQQAQYRQGLLRPAIPSMNNQSGY